MDTDLPPAHDSPKNILNVLNDDCIELILRRLGSKYNNIDLLNAAATCKRFRETAKRLISRFRSIAIGVKYCRSVSDHQVPILLTNFGHLIEELRFQPRGKRKNHNVKQNDKIFKSIAKYCGKTLKKLEIENYNPTFNKKNLFQALEKLILKRAYPKTFHLYSPLKVLTIESISLKEQPRFLRPFPDLLQINFNDTKYLTDKMLTFFMSLCPRLESLRVNYRNRVSPMILENIAAHSQNWKSISIHTAYTEDNSESVVNQQLQHLRVFRKLWNFSLDHEISLETLMSIFAKNHIPIWQLSVRVLPTNITPHFPINNTLVHLCLQPPSFGNFSVSDDFLIKLIKSLTVLETLEILNFPDSATTTRTIEKII